ncbi:MAG: hypothetical protein J07HX5_01506 [halophilic archaeon J07HX5]|nr:MAG: hypothetical protein J07HX5_01506 [halophilic archaeon J07HX5]
MRLSETVCPSPVPEPYLASQPTRRAGSPSAVTVGVERTRVGEEDTGGLPALTRRRPSRQSAQRQTGIPGSTHRGSPATPRGRVSGRDTLLLRRCRRRSPLRTVPGRRTRLCPHSHAGGTRCRGLSFAAQTPRPGGKTPPTAGPGTRPGQPARRHPTPTRTRLNSGSSSDSNIASGRCGQTVPVRVRPATPRAWCRSRRLLRRDARRPPSRAHARRTQRRRI